VIAARGPIPAAFGAAARETRRTVRAPASEWVAVPHFPAAAMIRTRRRFHRKMIRNRTGSSVIIGFGMQLEFALSLPRKPRFSNAGA